VLEPTVPPSTLDLNRSIAFSYVLRRIGRIVIKALSISVSAFPCPPLLSYLFFERR